MPLAVVVQLNSEDDMDYCQVEYRLVCLSPAAKSDKPKKSRRELGGEKYQTRQTSLVSFFETAGTPKSHAQFKSARRVERQVVCRLAFPRLQRLSGTLRTLFTAATEVLHGRALRRRR